MLLPHIGIIGIFSSIIFILIITFKKYFIAEPREFLTMGEHSLKKSTPSMGGFIFFPPLFYGLFFFYFDPKVLTVCLAGIFFGLIGFIDDWIKINKKKGLSASNKFFLHSLFAIIISIYWYNQTDSTTLNLFFLKIDLGIFYILWTSFVMIATSHAVNITDGLDGLAIFHSILVLVFGFMLSNLFYYSSYLYFISNNSILYLYSMIIISLSFFGFCNFYPARIFMGDTGALCLGGIISTLFIIFQMELMLPVVGIFFVIETLSVIIQYIYFKKYKTRFFLCAPLHHHFEKKKWHEVQIVSYSLMGVMLFYILLSIFLHIIL